MNHIVYTIMYIVYSIHKFILIQTETEMPFHFPLCVFLFLLSTKIWFLNMDKLLT